MQADWSSSSTHLIAVPWHQAATLCEGLAWCFPSKSALRAARFFEAACRWVWHRVLKVIVYIFDVIFPDTNKFLFIFRFSPASLECPSIRIFFKKSVISLCLHKKMAYLCKTIKNLLEWKCHSMKWETNYNQFCTCIIVTCCLINCAQLSGSRLLHNL